MKTTNAQKTAMRVEPTGGKIEKQPTRERVEVEPTGGTIEKEPTGARVGKETVGGRVSVGVLLWNFQNRNGSLRKGRSQ